MTAILKIAFFKPLVLNENYHMLFPLMKISVLANLISFRSIPAGPISDKFA